MEEQKPINQLSDDDFKSLYEKVVTENVRRNKSSKLNVTLWVEANKLELSGVNCAVTVGELKELVEERSFAIGHSLRVCGPSSKWTYKHEDTVILDGEPLIRYANKTDNTVTFQVSPPEKRKEKELKLKLQKFNADIKEAIVITTSSYTQQSGFAQLTSPKNDGREIKKFLSGCGFDVNLIQDRATNRIEKAFNEIKDDAKKLEKFGKKALYYLYYSGHGTLLDGTTRGHDIDGAVVDIEKWARDLSAYPNTYVIAFFDCCRQLVQHKGLSSETTKEPLHGQIHMVFSSSPSQLSLAVTGSTLSKATEKYLSIMKNGAKLSYPFIFQSMIVGTGLEVGLYQATHFVDFEESQNKVTKPIQQQHQQQQITSSSSSQEDNSKNDDVENQKISQKFHVPLENVVATRKLIEGKNSISLDDFVSSASNFGIEVDDQVSKIIDDIWTNVSMGSDVISFESFVWFNLNLWKKYVDYKHKGQ
eukprot:TRINITY_DN2956_c0_g1_i1.p1 TRINITY_DN2956_c0_g1~~TRINITY_DN2956_c0_g1_i1.p1  ORF type:complete len:475 (+),score=124.50 TRINITY_DN2956_c0_g1_i1:7-1431(+)